MLLKLYSLVLQNHTSFFTNKKIKIKKIKNYNLQIKKIKIN
jgi:hypothetical protein